jgi:hypothetical protein
MVDDDRERFVLSCLDRTAPQLSGEVRSDCCEGDCGDIELPLVVTYQAAYGTSYRHRNLVSRFWDWGNS